MRPPGSTILEYVVVREPVTPGSRVLFRSPELAVAEEAQETYEKIGFPCELMWTQRYVAPGYVPGAFGRD